MMRVSYNFCRKIQKNMLLQEETHKHLMNAERQFKENPRKIKDIQVSEMLKCHPRYPP